MSDSIQPTSAASPATREAEAPVTQVPGGVPDHDTLLTGLGDSQPAQPFDETAPRMIAGYLVEGELGRGGMGVVYKARQAGLNRLVAVKMILHADHAGPAERLRFLREAETLAKLQHPNIVQIHEVGEYEGKPFISLEYVEGGSLDRRLSAGPLPARGAAVLVETLAHAVQAAHDAGIIHRDLKPANVLLAACGLAGSSPLVPKITDFGLARDVAEKGQTQSGAVVGTPSYMAPEQAAGKVREIDARADVYALGTILYECLTGRPPFRAATPMETVFQVLHEEPVSVRQLQASVPGDLETICHHALQKEPGKRYSQAVHLAEDLGRFLRGEPIHARPVGTLERGWRWCRRNPLVASLLGAVFALLAGGAALAGGLALDAAAARRDAEEKARQAEKKEGEAVAAREDVERGSAELRRSRDRLEQSLVRGWLRPLGSQAQKALADAEIEALWELAGTQEEGARMRFVKEALERPEWTRQLKNRNVYALHAAAGLDLRRRATLEQLLLTKLSAGPTPDEERVDLALSLTALGGLDGPGTATAAEVLVRAMGRESKPAALRELAESLAALAARMDPRAAAAVCAEATLPLARAIVKTTLTSTAGTLSQALLVLATHMEPKESARLCGQAAARLVEGMGDTRFPTGALKDAAITLAALASRMESAAAAAVCSQAADTITRALSKTTYPMILKEQVSGLLNLVAYMEPKAATAACGLAADVLGQALGATTSLPEVAELLASLEQLARHLDSRRLADVLSQALCSRTTPRELQLQVPMILWKAVGRIDSGDAARAATRLCQALSEPATSAEAAQHLSRGVELLAGQLEPVDAAPVADSLVRAADSTMPGPRLSPLLRGLQAVAARMDPNDTVRSLNRSRIGPVHGALMMGLIASPVRTRPMDSAACTQAADALLQTMKDARNESVSRELARHLAALASRMESKEAVIVCGQAAALLAQSILAAKSTYGLGPLAQGLSLVAAHLEPGDAVTICSRAATVLSQWMSKEENSYRLRDLAGGLTALAGRMESKAAAVSCAGAAGALVRALRSQCQAAERVKDTYVFWALPQALAELAVHMEPRAAAAACGQAADACCQALTRTTNARVLQMLAQALPVLAPHLDPRAAAAACGQAADVVIQAMKQPANADERGTLAYVLIKLAAHADPGLGAEALAGFIRDASKARKPTTLRGLTEGLSALAARMDPQAASALCGQVVAVFTDTLSQKTARFGSEDLVEGITTLAVHLRPRDLLQAAAPLVQALSQTKDPGVLRGAGRALAALAARMDPADVACCRLSLGRLCEAVSRERTTATRGATAPTLTALLAPVDSPGWRQRLASTVAGAGSAGPGGHPLAGLIPLTPAAVPLPCPLATQQLVDLLKHPLCVGEVRRIILGRLGDRYARTFNDQWEFVRFAQERQLGLDFTVPPERSEPAIAEPFKE